MTLGPREWGHNQPTRAGRLSHWPHARPSGNSPKRHPLPHADYATVEGLGPPSYILVLCPNVQAEKRPYFDILALHTDQIPTKYYPPGRAGRPCSPVPAVQLARAVIDVQHVTMLVGADNVMGHETCRDFQDSLTGSEL